MIKTGNAITKSYLNGQPRPLFVYFRSFPAQFLLKNCWLQQDSNSDRRSIRQARLPLDQNHDPSLAVAKCQQKLGIEENCSLQFKTNCSEMHDVRTNVKAISQCCKCWREMKGIKIQKIKVLTLQRNLLAAYLPAWPFLQLSVGLSCRKYKLLDCSNDRADYLD